MALTPAERQKRYINKIKAKAEGKEPIDKQQQRDYIHSLDVIVNSDLAPSEKIKAVQDLVTNAKEAEGWFD